MIETHRLTIIVSDTCIITDTFAAWPDLSACNIPPEVHALQWNSPVDDDPDKKHLEGLEYGQGIGWIEFIDESHNEDITSLPEWAINAYNAALTADNKQNY